MAMTPLAEVLAAVGKDATVEEKVGRLQHEIEKLGDPSIQLIDVIDEYVTDISHLLIGLVLDLAQDLGALPQGRDTADREAHDAVVFLKTIAVYKTLEQAGE